MILVLLLHEGLRDQVFNLLDWTDDFQQQDCHLFGQTKHIYRGTWWILANQVPGAGLVPVWRCCCATALSQSKNCLQMQPLLLGQAKKCSQTKPRKFTVNSPEIWPWVQGQSRQRGLPLCSGKGCSQCSCPGPRFGSFFEQLTLAQHHQTAVSAANPPFWAIEQCSPVGLQERVKTWSTYSIEYMLNLSWLPPIQVSL